MEFTVVKAPPTKIEHPSLKRAFTAPSAPGLKEVAAPVVVETAAKRVRVLPETVPVKVPPKYKVVPETSMV
jgi:hypothetical protein